MPPPGGSIHANPPAEFSRAVCTLSLYFYPLFVVPSECSPGWYGRDCERQCQCRNGGSCDTATGMCHCPAGFIGADCGIGECCLSHGGWGSRAASSGGCEGWEVQTLPTERLLSLWGMSSTPGMTPEKSSSCPSSTCAGSSALCVPGNELQMAVLAVRLSHGNVFLLCLFYDKVNSDTPWPRCIAVQGRAWSSLA